MKSLCQDILSKTQLAVSSKIMTSMSCRARFTCIVARKLRPLRRAPPRNAIHGKHSSPIASVWDWTISLRRLGENPALSCLASMGWWTWVRLASLTVCCRLCSCCLSSARWFILGKPLRWLSACRLRCRICLSRCSAERRLSRQRYFQALDYSAYCTGDCGGTPVGSYTGARRARSHARTLEETRRLHRVYQDGDSGPLRRLVARYVSCSFCFVWFNRLHFV